MTILQCLIHTFLLLYFSKIFAGISLLLFNQINLSHSGLQTVLYTTVFVLILSFHIWSFLLAFVLWNTLCFAQSSLQSPWCNRLKRIVLEDCDLYTITLQNSPTVALRVMSRSSTDTHGAGTQWKVSRNAKQQNNTACVCVCVKSTQG